MILLRDSKITIRQPEDVAHVLQGLLKIEDRIEQEKEHYYVLHLDARSRINLVELVAVGIINQAVLHPRETYRRAVLFGSVSIIVAHNHPSGEVEPSTDDLLATRRLQEAGEVLGIPLVEHLIFTATDFYSLKSNAKEVR